MSERFNELSMLARLGVARVSAPRWAWVVPALMVVLAGILRFVYLAHPNAIVFDETYYAKDAYSYLHYGYELNWTKEANGTFVAGKPFRSSDGFPRVCGSPSAG